MDCFGLRPRNDGIAYFLVSPNAAYPKGRGFRQIHFIRFGGIGIFLLTFRQNETKYSTFGFAAGMDDYICRRKILEAAMYAVSVGESRAALTAISW
jgi:hypothetical protein